MAHKALFVFIFSLLCFYTKSAPDEIFVNSSSTTVASVDKDNEIDLETYRMRLENQTKSFEKGLKNMIKGAVKNILPTLMSYGDDSPMSTKCTRGFVKYISGLTSVKVWAMKMFDSMSKPPSGVLEGTFSDFGAFDQCLEIELPTRNGGVEFRGQYCAIEAKPILPPVPRNFSLAKQTKAGPLDSISEEIKIAGMAFYYLKFRLGVCVPSTCSLEDIKIIGKKIGELIQMDVQIPQCYMKEDTAFKTIHIVVICFLSLLLLASICGTVIEYNSIKNNLMSKEQRAFQKVFLCFSLISNYRNLMRASKGAEELKALHGLRAISMAWVILGHSYVWTNFQLLRRPNIIPKWFNSWDFEAILNGWLAVETFFLLSGLLTSYAVLKIMPNTKGKLNVPVYILRRYLRLTPLLLLTIGLAFFMPLLSSGPFWYERVDPELKACTEYWWASIIYISNWISMKNICVHPTWYLSADFQLHVISALILYILYRSPKLGLSLIAATIVACNIVIGVLTYLWDLPPTIQISSGNNRKIGQTLDVVHIRTFAHAGPYFIGIIIGYLLVKFRDVKMNKFSLTCGWMVSIVLSLTALYGAHRWNIGEPHGPLLTCLFAALHRTTFSMGVGWVIFACVTGHGGIVNKLLSSHMLAPLSRLTFLVYLLHSLVMWVRKASLRERMFFSHYNMLYEYAGNVVFTFLLTVPFYLLLEAPLSNLERLVFSSMRQSKREEKIDQCSNGNLPENMVNSEKNARESKEHPVILTPVELRAVNSLEFGHNNLTFSHS